MRVIMQLMGTLIPTNLINITTEGSQMTKKILTQYSLKELLHYCPDSGLFTWRPILEKTRHDRSRNTRFANKQAGHKSKSGYVEIRINGKSERAGRLAFLYMTGEMPQEAHHDDHDQSNNKWSNLSKDRHVNNMRNRSIMITNTSGVTGVCQRPGKRWGARITVDRKEIWLGTHGSRKDAEKAKKEANVKYGFHENHGGHT